MNTFYICAVVFWISSGQNFQAGANIDSFSQLETTRENNTLYADQTYKLDFATEYNGKCQEDNQCAWLGENSNCKYGACVCKENFRWFKGKCIRYSDLNGNCTGDVDCFDGRTWGSMKCQDKKCICQDGYQLRGNVECRKISQAGGPCALNIDCPKDYACVVGQCKKLSKLFNLRITDVSEEEFQPEKQSLYDEEASRVYQGKPCQSDADCTSLSNSECFSKTCVCKPGYFLKDNICEAELGMKTCLKDDDCRTLQAVCTDVEAGEKEKYCRCRDYWFYSEDNRKCIKTMLETNWNCLSNEWCYALGAYSYCSSVGTCKCSAIAQLNKSDMLCQKVRDSALCRSNNECSFLKPHSMCIDEECKCEENFIDSDNACHAVLGAECQVDEDCQYTKDAVCSSNKCSCKNGFVESASSNTICLPIAEMGGKCVEDIQCSTKDPKTTCVNGERCDCKSSYRNINDTCQVVRTYQEYCTNSKQCKLENENLICRNSKCQCSTNMKLVGRTCETSSGVFPHISLSVILITVLVWKLTVLSFI